MAAVLATGPGALLGRRDAAALRDLRPAGSRSRVDVLVPGTSRRRRPGIATFTTSTLHSDDRDEVDGVPVTSPERTIVDLADVLDARDLRRVLERAKRLCAIDHAALSAVISRNPGRHGLRILLPLLAEDHALGAAAESELERLFFDLIRAHGLPEPLAGQMVCGYVVDAYWPRSRLVVELQGYEFHSDRETFERDHAKLATLTRHGIELLALTYRQVTIEPVETATLLALLIARRADVTALTPG
jgi:very-short-patch-repair endonuclease